ncbi:MAG: pyridoxal phosphate-dependent aminotransferase [Paracoccaceae bacterium]|nr:pyridoxal phosphate-dependent aminotransferase [Paracoccaceae bacterium]MDE2914898.1 pyridoxal phosphate-dependent aminotransferase [Paracoccaceae bacterium]
MTTCLGHVTVDGKTATLPAAGHRGAATPWAGLRLIVRMPLAERTNSWCPSDRAITGPRILGNHSGNPFELMTKSRRIRNINPDGDDGWDIYYRGRKRAAAGEDVLELTIGDHDFRTPGTIIDVMARSARQGNTGYSPVAGSAALRRAIAARVEARTGISTGPENVLVTAGGQAALLACHLAVLDAGDTGLYVDPYYATFPGTIRATGANARPVPVCARDNFLPSVDAIAGQIDESVRSLLLNSPNNPTGTVYDRESLKEIGMLCRNHGLWLISDEVYETLNWSGEHVSPRAIPNLAPLSLVVGSLSKSFAMTGFRCGWVIGPEDMIASMAELATVSTYGVPGFIQDAALHALTQGQAIEDRLARLYRRRAELAKSCLSGTNAIRLIPPLGGMYVFLDIRTTGLTGTRFAERLLAERGIAVMPGESFGGAGAGHIRVALTAGDPDLRRALDQLATFAEELTGPV